MKCNVGAIDRVIRVVVGIVLLLMTPLIGGFVGYPVGGIVTNWGWIGVIPLVTGLVGFCPAYSLIGVSTCKTA